MRLEFPKNFLWGAGYSSHQVEGNNVNNDWWEWEQKGKTQYKSGWACDSWNRYIIDHQLAQDLGLNAFRLSLEWSRIEPEEGVFSQEALEHYKKVLEDLRKRKIKTVVTLIHYTLPLWFAKKYGWHHQKSVELFTRYCQQVIDYLGDEIDIVNSLNEPRLALNRGYLTGSRPPAKINPLAFFQARKHMVQGQIECDQVIKKSGKNILSGLTQFCNDFDFFGKPDWGNMLTEKVENFYNWHFFDQVGDFQDYIGINYYQGYRIRFGWPMVTTMTQENRHSNMGWGMWPEGLYEMVMDAWQRYRQPIYIFENGLADSEDENRQYYIQEHLRFLHQAIKDGADVRGYFHWALIDNFEWEAGFDQHFGLCAMNYETMERTPRPSYHYYQKIIKENAVEI